MLLYGSGDMFETMAQTACTIFAVGDMMNVGIPREDQVKTWLYAKLQPEHNQKPFSKYPLLVCDPRWVMTSRAEVRLDSGGSQLIGSPGFYVHE